MPQPISLRLKDETIERLGLRARRAHLPPRTLAQRYVEEGLRIDEHPLVRFADGPAGRRARLLGAGGDVWEVIATVRDNDGNIADAADYLETSPGLVQATVTYYTTARIPKRSTSGSRPVSRRPPLRTRRGSPASRPWAVKLLLDEMLSPAITRQLRASGHDVEAVKGNHRREVSATRRS